MFVRYSSPVADSPKLILATTADWPQWVVRTMRDRGRPIPRYVWHAGEDEPAIGHLVIDWEDSDQRRRANEAGANPARLERLVASASGCDDRAVRRQRLDDHRLRADRRSGICANLVLSARARGMGAARQARRRCRAGIGLIGLERRRVYDSTVCQSDLLRCCQATSP